MKKTSTFKKRNSEEIYHIHKPLNCNFKNTVECSNVECIMLEKYFGNPKTHRKFKNKKQELKEASK